LPFEHHRHGNGPYHYAITRHPILEIYPLPKESRQADNTTRLGFTVEDANQIVENLRKKGVKIVSEPSTSEWGFCAVVEDIDGRKIEVIQAKSID